MEMVKGIHRVEAPLGERFVCMYLLVGDDATGRELEHLVFDPLRDVDAVLLVLEAGGSDK